MRKKIQVLLLACGRYLGLSFFPATLARGGCEVDIVARSGEWCAKSRYLRRKWIVQEDGPDFCIKAHEIIQSAGPYDLVIPCDNGVLKGLVALAHEPWARDILPVVLGDLPPDFVYSKIPFCRIAAEWGLPIVPTAVIGGPGDIDNAIAVTGFPMIVKPPALSAGRGVWLADSREQIEGFAARTASAGPIVVQRFIAGQVSGVIFLMKKGRPILGVGLHKHHTNPSPFGPTSITRQMSHPRLKALLETFGEKTSYTGFGQLDLVFEPGGEEFHIIEGTFRPVPMMYLTHRFGASFGEALAAMLRGEESSWTSCDRSTSGKSAALFPQELLRALDYNRPDWLVAAILRPSFWRGLPPPDWPVIASHLGLMGDAIGQKVIHLARKLSGIKRKGSAVN